LDVDIKTMDYTGKIPLLVVIASNSWVKETAGKNSNVSK